MKITKIGVHIPDCNFTADNTMAALKATFLPFRSLTNGVDGTALAMAMISLVDAEREKQPGLASALIALVWRANTNKPSTVEVGGNKVSLRSPTTGTIIRLQRRVGNYFIEVDFGIKGSKSRSMTILAAAERSGVHFTACVGSERIERKKILEALLNEAERHLNWLRGLESNFYTERDMTEFLVRAREAVAFFEKAV